jgi:diguanylate cyclase
MTDALPAGMERRKDRAVEAPDLSRVDARAGALLVVVYLIDAALLAGYCGLGLAGWIVPALYVATGIAVAGGFGLAAARSKKTRLKETTPVLVQTMVALFLTLGVAWSYPGIAILMLLTVVVILPTAALRLSPRQLLVLALLATVGCVAVVVRHQGQLSIPIGSLREQALTGAFFLWTLIKGTSVNLAGMALRLALDDSHSKLSGALARVEELAETDELTGLANRRRILDVLLKVHEQQSSLGRSFAVAMLDVDHFKRINDTYGHALGDEVLRIIGTLMRGTKRVDDAAGRIGGEEFLLVLPGTTTAGEANAMAERLRLAVEGYDWSKLQPELHVTASIGLTVAQAGEDPEKVLRRADEGLYEAKRSGRNRTSLVPAISAAAS